MLGVWRPAFQRRRKTMILSLRKRMDESNEQFRTIAEAVVVVLLLASPIHTVPSEKVITPAKGKENVGYLV
jgi:hypothetical protein